LRHEKRCYGKIKRCKRKIDWGGNLHGFKALDKGWRAICGTADGKSYGAGGGFKPAGGN
jgi:hypothetical protein